MEFFILTSSECSSLPEWNEEITFKIWPRLSDNPSSEHFGQFVVPTLVVEGIYEEYWKPKFLSTQRISALPEDLFIFSDSVIVLATDDQRMLVTDGAANVTRT